MLFKLFIIGDEILHGSRQDAHFPFFKNLLAQYGFKLHSAHYLPDEREELVRALAQSFSDGLPTFVTGGIGATPDDHTRQAAAAALGLPLAVQPEAAAFIEELTLARGDSLDSAEHRQRLNLATFPAGAGIIPNPYNRVAGFHIREHYFLPGFPVMAHPMAEWVLNRFYADQFHQSQSVQRTIWIAEQPESRLAPIMERIEQRHPGIRTFSLPSVAKTLPDGRTVPAHIEFGLKAENDACARAPQAWQEMLAMLETAGIGWQEQSFV